MTFTYYATIPVNFTADGAQTDYPDKLVINSGVGANTAGTIYLNSHALNWPYDIKFTNANGTTLSYWRESYNASTQTVWVKLDSIASSGVTSFNLSYGDVAFADSSSGTNTFTFFDDFTGSSIDTSKWTVSGTPTVSSSIATITSTADGIITKSTFGPGYSTRFRVVSQSTLSGMCEFSTTNGIPRTYVYVLYTNWPTVNNMNAFMTGNGTGNIILGTPGLHIYEYKRVTNTCLVYADNTYKGTLSGGSSANLYFRMSIDDAYAGNTITFDWCVVRKSTANEPTWATPGSESLIIIYPTYTDATGNIWTWDGVNTIIGWAIGSGTTSATVPGYIGGSVVTTMGSNALSNTNIASLVVSASIVTLAASCFKGMTSLTSFSMGGGMSSAPGATCLTGCTSLTSATITTNITNASSSKYYSTLLNSLTTLTTINISEGVTTLGAYSLAGCTALTSFTIPSNVTTIGNSFLNGCTALTSLYIHGSLTTISSVTPLTGCSSLTTATITSNMTGTVALYYNLFNSLTTLTTLKFGTAVTALGNSALNGCTSISSVTLPTTGVTLEISCFQGMTALASLTLPTDLVTINSSLFQGCTSLGTMTIPATVTTIGASVFSGCTKLYKIYFTGTVAPITVDSTWVATTPTTILGHASSSSNFPAPGGYFNLLLMGAYTGVGFNWYTNIPINFTVDGAQTNYPVKLIVNIGTGANIAGTMYLNNNAENWPYDIQFTNNTGTILSYWRESYTETTATVWVKADSIASTGTTALKIYYGQANYADASTGSQVFTFFDDFPGTSLDASKWYTAGAGAPTITIANSIMTLYSNASWAFLLSKVSFGTLTAMRSKIKYSPTGATYGQDFGYSTNLGAPNLIDTIIFSNNQLQGTRSYDASSNVTVLTYTIDASMYHVYDLIRFGSTIVAQTDNSSKGTISTYVDLATGSALFGSVGGSSFQIQSDWLLVRKVSTTVEPIWATPGIETFTLSIVIVTPGKHRGISGGVASGNPLQF